METIGCRIPQEVLTCEWLEERLDLDGGSVTGLEVRAPTKTEGFLGHYFFLSVSYDDKVALNSKVRH